jgi:DNA-binding MarR family transcriptional regulator
MARPGGRLSAAEVIAGECLAVRVRTLNRAISAVYDEALRPHGLRVGQLNLLVVVARLGTARPGDLCRILRMDKSTLSRDVEVLRRNGWLELDDAADARARPLKLSTAGEAILETVGPAWRQAQEKAEAMVGADLKPVLQRVVDRLWQDGATGH